MLSEADIFNSCGTRCKTNILTFPSSLDDILVSASELSKNPNALILTYSIPFRSLATTEQTEGTDKRIGLPRFCSSNEEVISSKTANAESGDCANCLAAFPSRG